MIINILTLFPEMFVGPFGDSIIARAQAKGLVTIRVHNLRDWTADKHKTADDRPFGGGTGMILKPEPIFKAVEEIQTQKFPPHRRDPRCCNAQELAHSIGTKIKNAVILLSPRGMRFDQSVAVRLSKMDNLVLICGRYEGVDERVSEHLVDEEISIGDYVLSGGELPAMVLTEAVVRLIPGVLEKEDATKLESFSSYGLPTTNYQLLEHPQYTRPEDFRGLKVPAVLLSGNHAEIEKWRREKSLEATKKNRPDLIG